MVLCAGDPVRNLAGLSLLPEHRRGHGALYDAVNCGRIDIARLRRSLAAVPLPRAADGRLTAAQVHEVITRLIEAGHWREGDPLIRVIFDAGHGPMRMAYQLTGLPVEILGRLRSDRLLQFPVPARRPGTNGRPPRHGRGFLCLTPPPGRTRGWPRRRKPPGVAPRQRRPGTACTPARRWPWVSEITAAVTRLQTLPSG